MGMTIVPPLIMKHHTRFPAPRCALPSPLPEGEGQSPEGVGQSPEGVGDRVSLREFHVKGYPTLKLCFTAPHMRYM